MGPGLQGEPGPAAAPVGLPPGGSSPAEPLRDSASSSSPSSAGGPAPGAASRRRPIARLKPPPPPPLGSSERPNSAPMKRPRFSDAMALLRCRLLLVCRGVREQNLLAEAGRCGASAAASAVCCCLLWLTGPARRFWQLCAAASARTGAYTMCYAGCKNCRSLLLKLLSQKAVVTAKATATIACRSA